VKVTCIHLHPFPGAIPILLNEVGQLRYLNGAESRELFRDLELSPGST
jgi:hypothetical protein